MQNVNFFISTGGVYALVIFDPNTANELAIEETAHHGVIYEIKYVECIRLHRISFDIL